MANWLKFSKMAAWDALVFMGFAYDEVTDDDIELALADTPHLLEVDTQLQWEEDAWLQECATIPESKKHAYRIAALVRDFQAGQLMKSAIELDTICLQRCPSGVSDGHHRIRALQFVGIQAGPFNLSGDLDLLEDLVRLAGTEPPPEAYRYCDARLFAMSADDVTI